MVFIFENHKQFFKFELLKLKKTDLVRTLLGFHQAIARTRIGHRWDSQGPNRATIETLLEHSLDTQDLVKLSCVTVMT
jgi:hypothetical protein